jgi:hypothetical protein
MMSTRPQRNVIEKAFSLLYLTLFIVTYHLLPDAHWFFFTELERHMLLVVGAAALAAISAVAYEVYYRRRHPPHDRASRASLGIVKWSTHLSLFIFVVLPLPFSPTGDLVSERPITVTAYQFSSHNSYNSNRHNLYVYHDELKLAGFLSDYLIEGVKQGDRRTLEGATLRTYKSKLGLLERHFICPHGETTPFYDCALANRKRYEENGRDPVLPLAIVLGVERSFM